METHQDRIEKRPDIMLGKPIIKGIRIPVSLIPGYLAAGDSTDKIIQEYPDLKEE